MEKPGENKTKKENWKKYNWKSKPELKVVTCSLRYIVKYSKTKQKKNKKSNKKHLHYDTIIMMMMIMTFNNTLVMIVFSNGYAWSIFVLFCLYLSLAMAMGILWIF